MDDDDEEELFFLKTKTFPKTFNCTTFYRVISSPERPNKTVLNGMSTSLAIAKKMGQDTQNIMQFLLVSFIDTVFLFHFLIWCLPIVCDKKKHEPRRDRFVNLLQFIAWKQQLKVEREIKNREDNQIN